jgi:membrane protease YdiL (CAAX protease family)
MNSPGMFLEGDQLRPIWRFFLSVVVLFASFSLTAEIVGIGFVVANADPSAGVAFFWRSLVGLVVLLAAFKLMTAVFDRRPLGSMGLAFHSRWWRELSWGMVVGGAMLCLAVLIEWGGGFVHFAFTPHPMFLAGCFSAILFVVAAAKEEVIFRGYAFQRLAEAITPVGAIAIMSAFFGLAHFANPHRTWISTLNTALVGIPFCVAYLRTRSLWMPIGIHFVWNLLQGFFMGLPVSGLAFSASVLTAHVLGPAWLTGGNYGPEGGLLATPPILLGIAYLTLSKRIYTTEEMQALVLGPMAPARRDAPITIFSTRSKKEETTGS